MRVVPTLIHSQNGHLRFGLTFKMRESTRCLLATLSQSEYDIAAEVPQ
jgi:hypothetical protein